MNSQNYKRCTFTFTYKILMKCSMKKADSRQKGRREKRGDTDKRRGQVGKGQAAGERGSMATYMCR